MQGCVSLCAAEIATINSEQLLNCPVWILGAWTIKLPSSCLVTRENKKKVFVDPMKRRRDLINRKEHWSKARGRSFGCEHSRTGANCKTVYVHSPQRDNHHTTANIVHTMVATQSERPKCTNFNIKFQFFFFSARPQTLTPLWHLRRAAPLDASTTSHRKQNSSFWRYFPGDQLR